MIALLIAVALAVTDTTLFGVARDRDGREAIARGLPRLPKAPLWSYVLGGGFVYWFRSRRKHARRA